MPYPDTIAIDGPSAAGKSTIGELLARELNYLYLDTGVMYRAVTVAALQRGVSVEDDAAVRRLANEVDIQILQPTVDDGRQNTICVDGQDITWELRRPEVDLGVSPVSANAGVRAALTLQQRRIGRRGKVVMVGRDIGTVVLPDADLKIYLDATAEARARRRYLENVQRGQECQYDAILKDMCRRDRHDSSRQTAPLRPAPDAVMLDTTDLDVEGVMVLVRRLVQERDP